MVNFPSFMFHHRDRHKKVAESGRNGAAAGTDERMAREILSMAWPQSDSAFGWFAAEAAAAKTVRDQWRGVMGFGRDQTLVAAYWRRGATGLMAG
ncbi:SIP domain-containing protein [Manganibacter manganicus]|uniref:SIP-like Rossmann fold domain-containing protein n=1 Tax=Manganibacter manganicus TaxID=1873176 RepID=A0A1V8RMR2_9HYPH|nr:SIP domain-containing protein [Pseudaminobacter manganicus]OQM74468.1 hypothetical protein BFN67_21930 [Pseudaminobacter manganicus]